MRILAALLLMVATAQAGDDPIKFSTSDPVSITVTGVCAFASISSADDTVTIDWSCVDKNAETYRSDHPISDIFPAIAHILQAVRDGQAKSK